MPDPQRTRRPRDTGPGRDEPMTVVGRSRPAELAELRKRLEEAEETIRAIRAGEVDAFVMTSAGQEDVFALEAAADPYRRLVERMQQGAATLGPDGAIFFCNQRFLDMLRIDSQDVFGRDLQSFVAESDLALWQALEREALERGESHGEIAVCPPNGPPVPVHVALAPFGRGEVGLSVMVTDLTDRKRHEVVLAAETLSKSILEQAADAIIVCDAGGTIIRTSHVAQALCGRNAMLLPFDSAFELTPPSERPGTPPPRVSLKEVLEGRTIRGQEVSLRRENGNAASLLMSAAPSQAGRADDRLRRDADRHFRPQAGGDAPAPGRPAQGRVPCGPRT